MAVIKHESEPVPTMERNVGCPRCKRRFDAEGTVAPDQGGRHHRHKVTNQRHLHVIVPRHELERVNGKPEKGWICPASKTYHTVSVTANEKEVLA